MSNTVAPLSVREAKKQENRRAILNAGRRVFTEIGFEAATIRDIVRESGLAQGSFYNYFDTKQAVFEVIVEEVVQPIRERLKTKRQAAPDGEAFIGAAYQICVELTAFDPQTAALMRRNQSVFRQMFYQNRARSGLLSDLIEDIETKIASGVFAPHDAGLMAETMIAAGVDLIICCLDAPQQAERRVAFLQDLFSKALLPPGGGAP